MHPNIMLLSHEDEDADNKTDLHPYWYAHVIGIYHVKVCHIGLVTAFSSLHLHLVLGDKTSNKLFKTYPEVLESECKGVNTSVIELELLCKSEVKLGKYPPESVLLYTRVYS